MAGDWIKMRSDLHREAEVMQMTRILGLDCFEVVGRLFAFWCWADTQTTDGRLRLSVPEDVDGVTKTPGFAAAMIEVGWLKNTPSGLRIPHFTRHNGRSAKRRAVEQRRKSSARDADRMRTECGQNADQRREEKRREKQEPVVAASVMEALADAGIGEPTRSRLAGLPGITIQRIRDTRDKYSGGLFVNAIMALCDKKPISRTADIPDVSPRLAVQRAEDAKVLAEREAANQEATT